MWRYVAGVKRVADVSTPTQRETTHKPKVKRQFFNERWRRTDNRELHDWLVFDESSQSMFAHTVAGRSFIVGTKVF